MKKIIHSEISQSEWFSLNQFLHELKQNDSRCVSVYYPYGKGTDTISLLEETKRSKTIEKKLEELQQIQPINDNIWFVFYQSKNLPNKQFSIADTTFYKILDEINNFLSSTKQTQFKIFKSQ